MKLVRAILGAGGIVLALWSLIKIIAAFHAPNIASKLIVNAVFLILLSITCFYFFMKLERKD
jgi:hypothetical protein